MAFKKGSKRKVSEPTLGVHLFEVLGVNLTKAEIEAIGGRVSKEPVFNPERQAKCVKDEEGKYLVHDFHADKFIAWFKTEFGREPIDTDYSTSMNVKAPATVCKITLRSGDKLFTVSSEWFADNTASSPNSYALKGEERKLSFRGKHKNLVDGKIKSYNGEYNTDKTVPRYKLDSFGAKDFSYPEIVDIETRDHRKGNRLGFEDFMGFVKSLLATLALKDEEGIPLLDKDQDLIQILGGHEALQSGDFSVLKDIIEYSLGEDENGKPNYSQEDRSLYAVLAESHLFDKKKQNKVFTNVAPVFKAVFTTVEGKLALPKFTAYELDVMMNGRGMFFPIPLPLKPVKLSIEAKASLEMQATVWRSELKKKWGKFGGATSTDDDASSSDASGDSMFDQPLTDDSDSL